MGLGEQRCGRKDVVVLRWRWFEVIPGWGWEWGWSGQQLWDLYKELGSPSLDVYGEGGGGAVSTTTESMRGVGVGVWWRGGGGGAVHSCWI